MRDRKVMDLGRRGVMEKMGELEQGETINSKYYVRKKAPFNKRKTKKTDNFMRIYFLTKLKRLDNTFKLKI